MIVVYTRGKASVLAKHIIEALRKNSIPEWIIDSENDLTLSNVQWRHKSWMRIKYLSTNDQILQFAMIGPASTYITSDLYADFHSKLAEMLLKNFDTEIQSIDISSALTVGVDESVN